jgi:hypothetical protein
VQDFSYAKRLFSKSRQNTTGKFRKVLLQKRAETSFYPTSAILARVIFLSANENTNNKTTFSLKIIV